MFLANNPITHSDIEFQTAIDWDYDGITFKSQWQAIRGNGKRSQTVVTTASSPGLKAGKQLKLIKLIREYEHQKLT